MLRFRVPHQPLESNDTEIFVKSYLSSLVLTNELIFIKNKMRLLKNKILLTFSFIIPFVICNISLMGLHIIPFGENTLLIADSGGLYINFIAYWARVLHGADSILYSFSKGLGSSMVGEVSYHLLQPFYLLFVFSNSETFPAFYSIVSVIMTSCCGVTMFILLSQLFGRKASNLIFSTSYALIGFNVVNNWQMQWLDGVIVLPLIFLGIWRIYHGKSPVLYTLSLAYSLFTNFFIGYELCIVSVLIFLTLRILYGRKLNKKEAKQISGKFFIGSFLACGITSFIWLPTILSLVDGRAKQISLADFAFEERFPLLYTAARLFSGANSINELMDGVPAVFCGILVLALVILYFMNREVAKREKAAGLFILGVLILSFQITVFSSVFQMFSRPNWFAYRYSFAFSFVLILLAAREFEFLEKISLRDTLIAGTALIVFAIIVFHTEYDYVNGAAAVLDFALLLIMWLGFYLYLKKPEIAPKKTLVMLLLLTVSINLYANYCLSIYSEKDWFTKDYDYKDGTKTLGDLIDKIQEQDTSLYRMESEVARASALNEPLGFGYYGVGYAGSCERQFVTHNLSRLGVTWFDMRNYYLVGMPASMDSFLGLKYVISRRDLTEEKNYKKLFDGTFDLQVFENPYALPMAVLSTDAVNSVAIENEPDVFKIQNEIWKALTGNSDDLYEEETNYTLTSHNSTDVATLSKQEGDFAAKEGEVEENSTYAVLNVDDVLVEQPGNPKITDDVNYMEYHFTAAKTGPIYLYDYGNVDPNQGTQQATLQYIGYYNQGDEVRGKILYSMGAVTPSVLQAATQSIYIAYANMGVLDQDATQIQSQNVTIEKPYKNRSTLVGTIQSDSAKQLLFTIPYDEGWILYVDGKKTELHKTLDLFMAADVAEGTHTYELHFFPVGLKAGLLISGTALLALVVWRIWECRMYCKTK